MRYLQRTEVLAADRLATHFGYGPDLLRLFALGSEEESAPPWWLRPWASMPAYPTRSAVVDRTMSDQ